MNKTDFLNNHYDSILNENINEILAGGKTDHFAAAATDDKRFSLALLIRPSRKIICEIKKVQEEIRNMENGMYFYPDQDLHITVIDILKGEENRSIPQEMKRYINVLEECKRKIHPFRINAEGITLSSSAVLVKGYYDEELEVFRDELRKTLKKEGLVLEERYKTVSCHITIARFTSPLVNPERLLKYAECAHPFGEMPVDSMELVFHNWYDTNKKILHNLPL